MNYYAGLDIGGTHGRLKLKGSDGKILGEFQSAGCSLNTDGPEKSRTRCRELILPALRALRLQAKDCLGICAAVSGCDSPSSASVLFRIFEEIGFPCQRIQIFNDCELFLYLSDSPALVAVSGTGSVCFGRGQDHSIVRTGGWNHILSDEGSGFDLGLMLLRAAADELDGRASHPLLTSAILNACGCGSLEEINEFLNRSLFEKFAVASLAKTGYQAACQGDIEAIRIHRECAEKLFFLIRDTFRKMNVPQNSQIRLWLWGSILIHNDLIRQELTKKLQAELPCLQPEIPHMTALDTALFLAESRPIPQK